MTLEIRPATHDDLSGILRADEVAVREERRHDYVSGAISGVMGREVKVLTSDGTLMGYSITGEFFGYPFLERIFTEPEERRRGVATTIMTNLELEFLGDRLFVSTNESNTPMRTLLVKRGYRVSGMIENLDPGDPELIFVLFRPDPDVVARVLNRLGSDDGNLA